MDTNWIARHLGEDPGPLREHLAAMVELIDSATGSVQRICSELRPQMLDVLGLFDAVESPVEEFQRRDNVACRLACNGPEIRDERHVTVLFRIVQEALTNISRHAGAREASVRLSVEEQRVVLEIDDDGRGITPEQVRDRSSLGLIGMRERVASLDGSLEIAGHRRRDTHLRVTLPLEAQP